MKKRAKRKKPYEKPAIVSRQKLEILAAICDSNWVPSKRCRYAVPVCNKLLP